MLDQLAYAHLNTLIVKCEYCATLHNYTSILNYVIITNRHSELTIRGYRHEKGESYGKGRGHEKGWSHENGRGHGV